MTPGDMTPGDPVLSLMHQAALQAGQDPDRLSFLHAVRVIQRRLPRFVAIRSGPPHAATPPASPARRTLPAPPTAPEAPPPRRSIFKSGIPGLNYPEHPINTLPQSHPTLSTPLPTPNSFNPKAQSPVTTPLRPLRPLCVFARTITQFPHTLSPAFSIRLPPPCPSHLTPLCYSVNGILTPGSSTSTASRRCWRPEAPNLASFVQI